MNRPRLVLATLALLLLSVCAVVIAAQGGDEATAPAFADVPRAQPTVDLAPQEGGSPAPTATATATPRPEPEPAPVESPVPDDMPSSEPEQLPEPTPTPARPRTTGPAQVIDRGVTTRRSVALTFDAGADRGYAEAILNELRRQRVRASFGMTGVWAQANPDLVQRMAAEGHQLMNHSYDHDSFTGLSTGRRAQTPAQRVWQLQTTEAIINELTGASTLPYFRSPYGDTDASVLRDIGANGYGYNVLWTVDSRGWLHYTAGQIIQRCLAQAAPGAIYVMHVGIQSQDGPALPQIINGLREQGYSFETIDQILRP